MIFSSHNFSIFWGKLTGKHVLAFKFKVSFHDGTMKDVHRKSGVERGLFCILYNIYGLFSSLSVDLKTSFLLELKHPFAGVRNGMAVHLESSLEVRGRLPWNQLASNRSQVDETI